MAESPESPRPRRLPWHFHPALTEERLVAAARLLVRGREEALARADYWAGDDAWSIGCRAYSFSRHQVRRAAEAGRFPWLEVLDDTHHFVFLIEGVPVRFYRGEADEPTKRTLRRQQEEVEQLLLALGGNVETDGLMFRFAVETGERGAVGRVVFLALRGDEGQTECFWPVPLSLEAHSENGSRRVQSNGAPVLQLPLVPWAIERPTSPAVAPKARRRTARVAGARAHDR